jgi:hypothetical protein
VKYSERIRNRQLEAVVEALGPAATLKIFSGDVPHRCADADPPGELAQIELPRRPFNFPDGGLLQISEPWLGDVHAKKGVAASFRIYDLFGECHIQGSITAKRDGGDLELDPPDMTQGQRVSIAGFTLDQTDASVDRWEREKG